MSKLFFEDYISENGKVFLPGANHVGIELDDGCIIEIAQYRHGNGNTGRHSAKVSSHDAIAIEPTAANCFEVGKAAWVAEQDARFPDKKLRSQVAEPPGFQERCAATAALETIQRLANLISGHSINTRSQAARRAIAADLFQSAKALRKVL